MNNKHLKRILNVLPVKIKWMINKQEHSPIEPDTIDGFFSWYMNEKRMYGFMDTTIKPIDTGDYIIIDIDYVLRELGSVFTYTLQDKINKDNRINYTVKISEGLVFIMKKTTYDNFTKSYVLTVSGEYPEINDKIDSMLYSSLKDLMVTTLLAKLDVVYGDQYKKEDIYEAIPCWFK